MMKKSLLYNLFVPDRTINKYFLTQSTYTTIHGYEGNSESKKYCWDMLLERHERAIEGLGSLQDSRWLYQAYHRDRAGLVPDHHKVSCHDFTCGGSCLPFIKNKQKTTTPVRHKHSEAQQKKGGLQFTTPLGQVSRNRGLGIRPPDIQVLYSFLCALEQATVSPVSKMRHWLGEPFQSAAFLIFCF